MSATTNPVPTHHWPQQSPISLAKGDSLHVKFPKSFVRFDYRDAPFAGCFDREPGHKNFVLDKPHSGKRPPTLKLGDVRAELVKIHLHTPSEHDLDGSELGGEIHLIHKIADPVQGSELLVVAVFFQESKSVVETDFFGAWAAHIGKRRAAKVARKPVLLDPRNLLPKIDRWFRYEGSLTSAPYSELVSWLVFVDPLGVDSADFRKLKKNAHQPERSIQSINRRFVIRNFS